MYTSRDAPDPEPPSPPGDEAVLLFAWQAMASPWGLWLRPGTASTEEAARLPPAEWTAVGSQLAEECRRLEELISRFSPRSEVFRINRDAAREAVLLDRETAELLEFAAFACSFTCGAFNPVRRRDGAPISGPPPAWSDVAFDPRRRTFRFLRPDVALDLGAIGKGWALERLAGRLQELGPLPPLLLSAGGSSWLAVGGTAAAPPWNVPIDDPWASRDGAAAEPLDSSPLAQQGMSVSWVRQAPSLSTKDETSPAEEAPAASDLWGADGAPLRGAQAGCVVRHPSPTYAEVLSTALLASDDAARAALLARLAEDPACAVDWLRLPGSSPRMLRLLPR